MLFLVFQLGRDRYALEASRVVEILPWLRLKHVPGAPRGVAGLCNYRGRPVPVIDLPDLALGRACEPRYSTRLILIKATDTAGEPRILGLLAERATTTMRREPSAFAPSGVVAKGAPYLGPVVHDEHGTVQWINPEQLLTADLQAALELAAA